PSPLHPLHSFPTRRSSDLIKPPHVFFQALSVSAGAPITPFPGDDFVEIFHTKTKAVRRHTHSSPIFDVISAGKSIVFGIITPPGDRKSTRLNSSHVKISYA